MSSRAFCSFFRSHVRVVPASANGSVDQEPSGVSARCAETSEKVTSTARASSNGASVIRTFSVPLGPDGELGDELPQALVAATAAARNIPVKERIGRVLL